MRIAAGIVLVLGLLLAVFAVATRGYRWEERSDRDRAAPDAELERPLAPEEVSSGSAPQSSETHRAEAPRPVATIAGTVTREDGSPFPGLRLGAKAMETMPFRLVSLANWAGPLVETMSDDRGDFVFEVRGEGGFGVRSLDPKWVVRQSRLLAPGDQEATLVASPALSVVGTIVDAETGERIPDASVVLVIKSPEDNNKLIVGSAKEGLVGMQWGIPDGVRREAFEVKVRVGARYYKRGEATPEFDPEQQQFVFAIGLEPLPATGPCAHLLEVVDQRGHAVEIPLTVSGNSDVLVRTEVLGPGRLRVYATPGEHMVTVDPVDRSSYGMHWVDEIEFRPGREDLTRCEYPAHGVILFRYPDEEAFTVGLDSDEESAVYDFPAGRERRYVCKPGEWVVGRVGSQREPQRVLVLEGAEVIVDLTDR